MTGLTVAPSPTLLQTAEAQGGPVAIVVATLLVLTLGFLLSVWIAWRLYAGYRGSGDRSMLALAAGLVLLTTVPTTVRVVVPTAFGGPPAVRILGASASEVAGLVVILLAIRTPRRRRHRVRDEEWALLVPAQAGGAETLRHVLRWALDNVGVIAPGVVAGLGAYVSWQAFRGYRRNDSAPMAWLAAGIGLLTVAPFSLSVGLALVAGVTDATALLAISLAQLAGLVVVVYSLLRA